MDAGAGKSYVRSNGASGSGSSAVYSSGTSVLQTQPLADGKKSPQARSETGSGQIKEGIWGARLRRMRVPSEKNREPLRLPQLHTFCGFSLVLVLHGSIMLPRRIDVPMPQHVGNQIDVTGFLIQRCAIG